MELSDNVLLHFGRKVGSIFTQTLPMMVETAAKTVWNGITTVSMAMFRVTTTSLSSALGPLLHFLNDLDEDTVKVLIAISGPVLTIATNFFMAHKQSKLQAIVENIWVFPIKSCGGLQLHTAIVDEFGLKYDRNFVLMTPSKTEGNDTFNMLTQRTCPKMANIQFGFVGSFLVATCEGMKPLCLGHMPELKKLLDEEIVLDVCPIEELYAREDAMDFEHRYNAHVEVDDDDEFKVNVQVWNDIVEAERVSDAHDAWFASVFGRDVVLGKISSRKPRFVVHRNVAHPELQPQLSFQDGFPMLSSSSMYDINNSLYYKSLQSTVAYTPNSATKNPSQQKEKKRKEKKDWGRKLRRNRKKNKHNHKYAESMRDIPTEDHSNEEKKVIGKKSFQPLSILRFRANVIIGNTPPFEEDTWHSVTINDIEFDIVKPCDRCTMPGVNPFTGERKRSKEMRAIMNSLRTAGGRVFMGQNAIPQTKEGSVAVGDVVTVNTRKNNGVSLLRWL
eukprot:m.82435 g.82435  ORF g.82435 m.82435 type:complete len:502 (-) comp12085_c0_seq4:1145-2650(-)